MRDAQAWSGYLDEAVVLFGAASDVMFGSHNWPTWGQAQLVNRLEEQRDMYGYLHDQTVRMMNNGTWDFLLGTTSALTACRGERHSD